MRAVRAAKRSAKLPRTCERTTIVRPHLMCQPTRRGMDSFRQTDSLAFVQNLPYAKSLSISVNNLHRRGQLTMKNPLDSIWGTIISGLVLTVVLYVFARGFLQPFGG